MVSMKVTWVEMLAETMGTKVSYLTFLSSVSGLFQEQFEAISYVAPSGRMTRSSTNSYEIPSCCLGPSRKGTFKT